MLPLIIIHFYFISIQFGDSKYNYCRQNIYHLLCGEKYYSSECGDLSKVVFNNLTFHGKTIVLGHFNKLRDKFAAGMVADVSGKYYPKVSNMEELVWDDELAYMSHRFLKRCSEASSPPENIRVERFPVGQSIAVNIDYYLVAEYTLISWHLVGTYLGGERARLFNVNDIYRPAAKGKEWSLRILQQGISASTKMVGCGAIAFIINATHSKSIGVCHFGPAMNVKNLFKLGPPCTKCENKRGCSDYYKQLCSAKNRSNVKPTPKYRISLDDLIQQSSKEHIEPSSFILVFWTLLISSFYSM